MTTKAFDIDVLNQFDRDTLYIDDHKSEWLNSFSDCWVVVYGEELICHAGTLEEALSTAREEGISQNMAVDRISSTPRNFLL